MENKRSAFILSILFLLAGCLLYLIGRPSALPFIQFEPTLSIVDITNYLPDYCWAAAFTASLWPLTTNRLNIIIWVIFVTIIIEILQYFKIWNGTGDALDILASLAGAITSYFMLTSYEKK